MPFHSLLARERIERVDGPLDRDSVIGRAATLLALPLDGPGLASADLADRIRERESIASTALGHGVAIPHARLAGLEHSRGAFLRLSQPVDFGAADGRPVDLVFAMAVPEHDVAGHLGQLAEIAESFADDGFRAALREAHDPDELASRLFGTSK